MIAPPVTSLRPNSLFDVLPYMFQPIEHYTELLLPDNLLREGSVIDRLVNDISECDFDVHRFVVRNLLHGFHKCWSYYPLKNRERQLIHYY